MLWSTLLLTWLVSAGAPQPATLFSAVNPQVSVRGVAEPEIVKAGTDVTLRFEITPGRRIRVYAPGAHYQVIAIKLDAQHGLKARAIDYPPSEMYLFEPLQELVPVYQKPFTLKQKVAVADAAVKGKGVLALTGRLEYQACDDKVCFKPATIPFRFELKTRR